MRGCLCALPLKSLWYLSLAHILDPILTSQEVSNQDLHGQIPRACLDITAHQAKCRHLEFIGEPCSRVSAQATITILQQLSLSTEGVHQASAPTPLGEIWKYRLLDTH